MPTSTARQHYFSVAMLACRSAARPATTRALPPSPPRHLVRVCMLLSICHACIAMWIRLRPSWLWKGGRSSVTPWPSQARVDCLIRDHAAAPTARPQTSLGPSPHGFSGTRKAQAGCVAWRAAVPAVHSPREAAVSGPLRAIVRASVGRRGEKEAGWTQQQCHAYTSNVRRSQRYPTAPFASFLVSPSLHFLLPRSRQTTRRVGPLIFFTLRAQPPPPEREI